MRSLFLLALFLFPTALSAASPLIWNSGTHAKNLASVGIKLNDGKEWSILSADPSAGGGFAAAIGSIGVRNNAGAGEFWFKTGAANTAWEVVPSGLVSLASEVTGTLPIGNGGTGQTTQTAAFDALDPLTTKGDLIVHNGTNSIREPIGTDNFVLTADSAQASGIKWAASSAGITQLTGQVTAGPGSGSQVATVDNAAVIAKVLTGYAAGAGTVTAADSILSAIQKLDGNDGNKANVTLNNLGSTAVNADIIPDAVGTRNLGSSSLPFGNYIGTTVRLSDIANVAFTGDTTITSPTVLVADTTGLTTGGHVSGAGIPSGALINSIVTNVSITLNVDATATATGVALIFQRNATIRGGDKTGTDISGPLNIRSGSSVSGYSGNVTLRSGNSTSGAQSGSVLINSGSATTVSSGRMDLISGATTTGTTGAIIVGSGVPSGAGASGAVTVRSGNTTTVGSGNVATNSGTVTTAASGTVSMSSGNASSTGTSGNVTVSSGSTTTNNSGTAMLSTGTTTTGTSGDVSIFTGGPSGAGSSGDIDIFTTPAASATSGTITISTGAATTRGTIVLDALSINASSKQIKSVADPTANQDAATKFYVDSVSSVGGFIPDTADAKTATGCATFTVPAGVTRLGIKAVAGGGSGGTGNSNGGGGGGAGGSFLWVNNFPVFPTQQIRYCVGAGGAAVGAGQNIVGNPGTNTVVGPYVLFGGNGGCRASDCPAVKGNSGGGATVASGGQDPIDFDYTSQTFVAVASFQGFFNGGTGGSTRGGGGAGASENGGNGGDGTTAGQLGTGGDGVDFLDPVSASTVIYGCGGGGGDWNVAVGTNRGCNTAGSGHISGTAGSGTANTGSGGGGAGDGTSGAGGSGLVTFYYDAP